MATKTVLPGMSTDAPSATTQFAPKKSAATIVPGAPQRANSDNDTNTSSRPILGFLYSVSRTAFGEFWPLYLGSNAIGRSRNCQICLPETSVSDSHATLVIRRMQHKGTKSGLFVFVQDSGSTCGTLINGDTLDFNPRECKSGDVITIGANYELYLILVDPETLKLYPKEAFKSADGNSSPANGFNPMGWAQGPVGMNAGGAPKGTIPEMPGASEPAQPSSNPFNSRKATIYMPPTNNNK
jgi:hypothetical protein